MADVQLEHGYIRLANRLSEAILAAPFGPAQLRILLALIRLTYGWRRRSVRATETDLARAAGMMPGPTQSRASGTFRAALKELVAAGVVLRVDGARGSHQSTFAIQKDFTKWGGYSVAEARLASMWDERPESDDRALAAATTQTTLDDMAQDQANSGSESDTPSKAATWPADRPRPDEDMAHLQTTPSETWPADRPSHGPPIGHVDGPKSLNGETLQRPKDMKDSSTILASQITTASKQASALATSVENAASEGVQQYAIGLSRAVNHAITARWGERLKIVQYSSGLDLAAAAIKAGIPLESACDVIRARCEASKKPDPPNTLEWFRQAVFEAWAIEEQRQINAQDAAGGAPTSARGGAPQPLLAIVRSGDADQARALEAEYDEARRRAVRAWSEAPAHAAEYQTVVAAVNRQYEGFGTTGILQRARLGEIVSRVARALGFPSFEAWRAARAAEKKSSENFSSEAEKAEGVPNPGVSVSASVSAGAE